MRFNIFRNPYVDAQVNMLLSSFDDGIRNQTEEYWRDKIAQEIVDYAATIGPENFSIDQLGIVFEIANNVRKGSN